MADSGNHRIQNSLATSFVLDGARADDGDANGASVSYEKLLASRYQVTKRAAGGWELVDLTCIGDNSSRIGVDLANRALTIDLAAEDHVTCMFANCLR